MNYLNISETVLRRINDSSKLDQIFLRLVGESTCCWYRTFDKTSVWFTSFLWGQIYTEKVTLWSTVHILSKSLSTASQRRNFDIYNDVTGNIKRTQKTTKNQLKLVNLVLFNYYKMCFETQFFICNLRVIGSCFWFDCYNLNYFEFWAKQICWRAKLSDELLRRIE